MIVPADWLNMAWEKERNKKEKIDNFDLSNREEYCAIDLDGKGREKYIMECVALVNKASAVTSYVWDATS